MKKIVLVILSLFALSSCDSSHNNNPFIGNNGNWRIGETDTGISAQGPSGNNGADGQDGEDGLTPTIGDNGNWWIGETDTGISAQGPSGNDGLDGKSSYEIYKQNFPGYNDDERQWIEDFVNGDLKVEISFETFGGSDVESISYFKGQSLGEVQETSIKAGFSFEGWYLDENLENKIDENDYALKDLTLYANWEPGDFKITYIINDEIYDVVTPNGDNSLLIDDPVIDGFDFCGRYNDDKYHEMFNINKDLKKETIVYGRLLPIDNSIPFINIETENEAEIVSKDEYINSYISIFNADENNISNVLAEVKGRGNSTWVMPKKPYKIKFDKKQSLFGKEKNKSWVLLADYLVPSVMNNYTAFSLSKYFNNLPYEPLTQHVRLYINGKYNGLYLLTEDPDEKEGRVNIEQDITTDMTEFNYMLDLNGDQPVDDEQCFMADFAGADLCVEIKYPKKDDFTSDEQFNIFVNNVKQDINELSEAFKSRDYTSIAGVIDEKSFIDYTLVDQIMGELDHCYKSYKFYKKPNEKFMFGPLWDYDFALNIPWSGFPNTSPGNPNINFNNILNQIYESTTEGHKKLAERWNEIGDSSINSLLNDLENAYNQILGEIKDNQEYWYDVESIGENNYGYLVDFIKKMRTLMNDYYKM